MSTKKQLAELDSKLKALNLRLKRSDEVFEKKEREAIERHRLSIVSIVASINTLKGAIEESKFSSGESAEAVEEWSRETEIELVRADEICGKLSKIVSGIDEEARSLAQAKQYEAQMQHEKQLLAQKYDAVLKEKELTAKSSANVRLPKLSITKFAGTPLDWVRFEGQFNAMVDSQNVPAITKFSHLKELVEPRVRVALDCLPFTEAGYDRAFKYLKEKYGHPNEVAGAYIINLLELPCVTERDVAKIHKFYEQLLFNVESLETLGKLNTIQGAAFFVIVKKLEILKAELVTHGSGDWREWSFTQLLEALRKWTGTNTVVDEGKEKPRKRDYPLSRGRAFNSNEHDTKRCVYCDTEEHKASECDKVPLPSARKRILMTKKLCFNCASGQHAANACKSKMSCRNCQKRHHTSICQSTPEVGLTANVSNTSVIHPVVIVKIKDLKFRALLDTRASHSYASETLINLARVRSVKSGTRRIATLMGTTTTKMSQFDLCLGALKGNFVLRARVTKINKRELLSLDNPRNQETIKAHQHLRGIELDDVPTKEKLPVHLILGANEYSKIRTSTQPRIGRQGEPVAELTRFGWALMGPGVESDVTAGFLAINSTVDHERLCSLDVLGLADSPGGDQGVVHQEFREQLTRDANDGWYETALPWKGNHPTLPNNRAGSLCRLRTQVQKLRKAGKLQEYDAIIREQLEQGIVERAPTKVVGREFYMSHRAVIKESAQSTKMRVVYDCSARGGEGAPSLNDCLDPGPPLQNKLWDVLIRVRFHAVALAGDLRKAFLQVRIREGERDALRFHWLRTYGSNEVETLRFTRALFGLAPSPFLLGGVIEQHLENWSAKRPDAVAEISRSLYVDDLISGAATVIAARELRSDAIEFFADAAFQLHKWHSNEPELESADSQHEAESEGETSFAKQQLGSTSEGDCKLLGLTWNKSQDTVSVVFAESEEKVNPTKRGILAKLARVYDPLGLVSPTTLQGKLIYREVCELKGAWDATLPEKLAKKWGKWENSLPARVTTGRSLTAYREPLDAVELHAFGDASGRGVATAIYAVVRQASGTTQGLVTAKSRLAKLGLTIPRLELVAGHMAANAVDNVRRALEGFPVTAVHCWLDSTVALHWICGGGEYRQFVANRVRKIQEKKIDAWRHVPTANNPADLGSRGGSVEDSKLWWNGPEWLSNPEMWPPNPVTVATAESSAEVKAIREVIAAVAVDETDEFDQLLDRHDLKRTLRVCAWMNRFVNNCRGLPTVAGPLTTTELESQMAWWIRRIQARAMTSNKFISDKLQLNLQANVQGILECRGRIQGHYPVYLPDDCRFTEKFVQREHGRTLHGGVGLTMASVREGHWVPRLRQLTKKVIRSCWGCKRFQARALAVPPPGLLPRERTEGSTAFQVVGVDFAGPIRYRKTQRVEGKAYLVLFGCSLSRALYLEILPDLDTVTFLGSLKRLVARRGRPTKIFSDNGGTFVGAARWLKRVRSDERLHNYLAGEQINWQFNLSRAPWWGGQFERLVGIFKRAFYKTIGGGMLSWAELAEVVLEVETQLNRRPLSYVEDDIQLPLLTPAAFLFQRTNCLPEPEPWREETVDLRKRAKYLRSCKDALWKRWTVEYVTELRERHQCNRTGKVSPLEVGDVVIIRNDERNRGKWSLGIVEELFLGRDGVVRSAKLRTGISRLERAVQQLFPLELACDKQNEVAEQKELNPEATSFRPKRGAATAANLRIQDIQEDEEP